MVEMHLLSVNADFAYDRFYALGIASSFDRFMTGYEPERDKGSIFNALCQSVFLEPEQIRQDAEQLKTAIAERSLDELKQLAAPSSEGSGGSGADDGVAAELQKIAAQENYKYSRLMAIGLYTLFETVDSEAMGDRKTREDLFEHLSSSLKISQDKLQKDLELYRSNLDKMEQAQAVLKDILAADRKKRAEREKAKAASGTESETASEPTDSIGEAEVRIGQPLGDCRPVQPTALPNEVL